MKMHGFFTKQAFSFSLFVHCIRWVPDYASSARAVVTDGCCQAIISTGRCFVKCDEKNVCWHS